MSSRTEILKAIRRQLPQSSPLPELTGDWIRYDEPVEQFKLLLESVGGIAHVVSSVEEIPAMLADRLGDGKRILSGVPGLLEPNVDFASIPDPHTLEDVDLAVLPGQWAVAENAAIWVQTPHLAERTLFFIAQQLVLVVPYDHVLNNMHEVYERITPETAPFSCFISGPSKTADIEQSLVKGAHGARTLTVFLVQNSVH